MTENLNRSVERDIGGDARLFVRGKCSACGAKAQRRMHAEQWFHVSRYDDYGIQGIRACPVRLSDGAGPEAHFVQETTHKTATGKVEPHYREKVEMRMDYDYVDPETGQPAPQERPHRQVILCTCTNPKCDGYGKPLPEEIRKLREET